MENVEQVIEQVTRIFEEGNVDLTSLWVNETGDDIRNRIQDKTDTCAKFMLLTMIQCLTLYKAKNADYGDSFSKTYAKYGNTSVLVRLSDKINRLDSLLGREGVIQRVKDESIVDTLKDIVNYSLMTMYELAQNKNK